MEWEMQFDVSFATWFEGFDEALPDVILAQIGPLRKHGPSSAGAWSIRFKDQCSPM